MKQVVLSLSLLAGILNCPHFSSANEANSIERLEHLATLALQAKYENAEIKLINLDALAENPSFISDQDIQAVNLVEDKPGGIAVFKIKGIKEDSARPGKLREVTQVIQLPFEAWVKTLISKNRIQPNQKLKRSDFKLGTVNVAQGLPREYRGIIAREDASVENSESKQTIFEGQFLTVSAIRKQPDIRRGDSVKINLISGELVLSTQGVAQEPASIGDRVRVITGKTKREVVGKLAGDQSVEVRI